MRYVESLFLQVASRAANALALRRVGAPAQVRPTTAICYEFCSRPVTASAAVCPFSIRFT
jgi:hypothetical protein